MNDRARNALRMVAGVYLIYLGGSLFIDSFNNKPNGYVGFMIIAILFAVIGVALIIINIKANKAEKQKEILEEDMEEEEVEVIHVNQIVEQLEEDAKENIVSEPSIIMEPLKASEIEEVPDKSEVLDEIEENEKSV